ncbi:MAG: hypothetical protein ABI904_09135 [Chloroflexota bacterium]
MIKITSFYPFQNLLRVRQEFYEDKAIVKLKSLTFEREFEFEYKEATVVFDTFKSNYSQTTFGFSLLGLMLFPSVFFHNFIYAHLILLRAEQALFILGLLLFSTSFKKTWRIYVLDKNDDTLAIIEQTRQTRDVVPQIMQMLRNKSEKLREYTSTNPFRGGVYKFEHVEYVLSSLSKTTERMYEKEIIGYRQSLFGKSVYSIQYDRLSGKVFRGKSGIDFAGWLLALGAFLMIVYGGFDYGFAIPFHIHISKSIFYTILVLFILSVISLLLNLIKQEFIGLYNKNGSVEYTLNVNRKNKSEVEKIIKYIQSKIPAEEKT